MDDICAIHWMLAASQQALLDAFRAFAPASSQTLCQYAHRCHNVDNEELRISPARFRQNGARAVRHHDIAVFQPGIDLGGDPVAKTMRLPMKREAPFKNQAVDGLMVLAGTSQPADDPPHEVNPSAGAHCIGPKPVAGMIDQGILACAARADDENEATARDHLSNRRFETHPRLRRNGIRQCSVRPDKASTA